MKTGDIVQVITYDQFINYGKSATENIVDGMPWSFEIFGLSVTHENNRLYLIEQLGEFTPRDVIVELYNEEYAILRQYELPTEEEIEKIYDSVPIPDYWDGNIIETRAFNEGVMEGIKAAITNLLKGEKQ